MAVHDYVIANGTGSAVRSDLNNALAAIVSNNSSSSEPGTTYAYQWWADTNANVLKIRNSSNDGWITLRELDGTMLIEDGSASSPGLSFASDTNSGLFGGSDTIGFATGGAERLEIGSSEVVFNDPSNDVDFRVESNGNASMLFVDGGNDRVAIGTSSPRRQFHIHNPASATVGLMLTNDNTGAADDSQGFQIKVGSDSHAEISQMENSHVGIFTNASERLRIDSSGRLLHGTTDAANLNNAGGASARQAKAYIFNAPGTTTERYNLGLIGGASSATGPSFVLNKTRATSNSHTVVQSGDELGQIRFQGSDGTNYVQAARIEAQVDGTPGTNDMPGRLVFSTTADGASSPTERMRLGSDGKLLIGSSTGSVHADRLLTVGKTDRSATYISITSATDGIGGIVFADTTTNDTGGYRGIVEYQHNNDDMVFRTSAVEHMRLLSEGRLKVTNTGGSGSEYHTNANFSSIHQSGGGNVIAGFENSHASDSYGIVIRFSGGAPDNNSNYYIECNDTSTTRFQVLSDGDVRNHDNSYGSTSDEKLKQDIVDAGSQWDDLKDLRVRKFKFKSDVAAYGDEAKVLIGLVAQEAELVSPGLVTDSPDLDDDGNDLGTVTKSVRYSVLYMKAVKALQEAMSRIETLEAKVAALEAG